MAFINAHAPQAAGARFVLCQSGLQASFCAENFITFPPWLRLRRPVTKRANGRAISRVASRIIPRPSSPSNTQLLRKSAPSTPAPESTASQKSEAAAKAQNRIHVAVEHATGPRDG
jgi:hypothetical protein